MPGYVIHLAVANEYLKKHKNDVIQNKESFLLGSINPHFTTKEKKGETHYGQSSSIIYLRKYLNSNLLNSDFNKGYFLHLVTDYVFYNKILEIISQDIYNDYDILNKKLMKKYNVKLPDIVKDKVFFTEGSTKILNMDTAENLIDTVSNFNLNDIRTEILSNKYTNKWDEIRILKRLDNAKKY